VLVCVLATVYDAAVAWFQTKEEETSVDSLLEGDIRLTMEQAERLLTDTRKPRRQKRKLTEPVSRRWPLPIPYTFDGSHS